VAILIPASDFLFLALADSLGFIRLSISIADSSVLSCVLSPPFVQRQSVKLHGLQKRRRRRIDHMEHTGSCMSVAARHLQLVTVKQLIVDAGFPFQTVIFRTAAVLVITEHRMSFR